MISTKKNSNVFFNHESLNNEYNPYNPPLITFDLILVSQNKLSLYKWNERNILYDPISDLPIIMD